MLEEAGITMADLSARFGIDDDLVDVTTPRTVRAWTLIGHLIDAITPALHETGDSDLVHAGLNDIRQRGTGARLQRDAYASTGSIDGVVDAVAARTVA